MSEIKEYNGWLKTSVSEDIKRLISEKAFGLGLQLDVGTGSVEFEYRGRDANGFVVRFLGELASALVEAEGEIECVIESPKGDPVFEFYRIENGCLIRQRGRIVRDPPEVVSTPEDPGAENPPGSSSAGAKRRRRQGHR